MTKRKLSSESKAFIQEVRDCFEVMQRDRADIDAELKGGNEKLQAFIASIYPWSVFYSLSLPLVAYLFYECLGQGEQLLNVARSEDKKQAKMALFREMVEQAEEEEIYDALDELDTEERALFLALLMALTGNLDALTWYNESISDLIARADKDPDALFKAIAVDRTVLGNPKVLKEIGLASIRHDESFMDRLAKAITRTIPRRDYSLDTSRFMIEVLDEVEGLENISYEQIAEFLQNQLQVYPDGRKDPESAIKKLLQRRKAIKGDMK